MKKHSITTAKNTLEVFFRNGVNSQTPSQIFVNADRGDKDEAANYAWFYNKLPAIRYFGLVEIRKEAIKGKNRIIEVSLTSAGKKLLGRVNDVATEHAQLPPIPKQEEKDTASSRLITLQSITDDVDEFNRQNPSWELEITPRRVSKD